MLSEQSQRNAFQAEPQARAVGHSSIVQLDSKYRSEMFLMKIEGRNGGWLFGSNGDSQLELQALLPLAFRKKLSAAGVPELIDTVWGSGYILREQAAVAVRNQPA